MATYKVIQDVESEDKLIGPLGLKGFIYAAITFVLAFINFKILISGTNSLRFVILLLSLPPMVLFGVLASPLGREQPTEVWLLARIRFLLKPRQRIWDQTGVSKLVTITAPKKDDGPRTKNLSQDEVDNRLKTLAVTLDSRGWAIKNLSLPMGEGKKSDRLVAPISVSSAASDFQLEASDDIMDEQNNPTAKNFNALMEEEDAKRRIEVANRLTDARKEAAKPHSQAKKSEKPVIKKIKRPRIGSTEVTRAAQADKLELAQSGSALSVASVAKLANRNADEVVIQLH